MTTIPRLTDSEITLREPRPEDADPMTAMCQDPQMLRFTRVPRPYTREHAAARISDIAAKWQQPDAQRTWVVEAELGEGPGFAGLIDLRSEGFATAASVGFSLHPAARGHGVMARAVRLLADWTFTTRPWGAPVARLHWAAVVGNWASRRVAWSCGFVMHGTQPGSHVDPEDPDGPPLDRWLASLVPGAPTTPQLPWFEAVPLRGDTVALRAWRDDDREALEPRDDPAHWMPPAAVLARETFPAWLLRRRENMASGQGVEWCIADVESDRALGSVVVFTRSGPLTGDVAELGYQLSPGARGRGVAKQAAALAIAYARRPVAEGGLGLRRLVAETAADNAASNGVLAANGFTVFGREHAVDQRADGSYGDGLFWELLLR